MKEEYVILVDEEDRELGTMEKLEAHRRGVLHRAFSVFIFNQQGEMLVQQRADGKYHSPGLWTNACCSHPAPGEELEAAAHRRLNEELGFDTGLEKVFDFVYRSEFDNGLTEYEFDHVFVGEYGGPVLYNTTEVQATEYLPVDKLKELQFRDPSRFTTWFRTALPKVLDWHQEKYLKSSSWK